MKVRALIGRIAAVVLVLALVGGGAYLFMIQPAKAPVAPAPPPPPQVGVVELKAADVPLPLEFSGRVAGFRVVEIRAQVSGVLLKREFLEGSVVDVGQVLFRIDPRTYEAASARANAQAAQAKATLIQAEENYNRQVGLAAQKVATQKSLEDAIAGRDQARANVQSTEADVVTAKLNLEFTTIKAPVKGPTSLVSPAEGTLIQAQQTLLTTITQLNPAYVNFTFTDFGAALPAGDRQVGRGAVRSRPRQGRAAVRRRGYLCRARHGGHALAHGGSPHGDYPHARHLPQSGRRPAAGPVRAREDDRHYHAQRHRGAQGRDITGSARAVRLCRRAAIRWRARGRSGCTASCPMALSSARAWPRATVSWSRA